MKPYTVARTKVKTSYSLSNSKKMLIQWIIIAFML